MPDLADFHAFTDDRSIEAACDWGMAVKFSEAERRLAARLANGRPVIFGGQVPIRAYEAERPVTGVEARRELTAQEELEAWFREVAVSNELD